MIRSKLAEYLKEINQRMKQINEALQQAPEGRLRSQMSKKKYPMYYWVLDKLAQQYPHGKYISKKDIEFAGRLAQKEYDLQLLAELQHQQKVITQFLKQFHYDSLHQLYSKFPEAKKQIIQPRILPDDQFIQAWYKAHPGEQNPAEIKQRNKTERGEIARSKSEKMIADKLFYMHIPYVYEPRVRLITNKDSFPDFLILNVRMRKQFYHEHLGVMDDPDYCKKVIRKLEDYEMSGICLGDNLTLTMECDGRTFSTDFLNSIIRRCFL